MSPELQPFLSKTFLNCYRNIFEWSPAIDKEEKKLDLCVCV